MVSDKHRTPNCFDDTVSFLSRNAFQNLTTHSFLFTIVVSFPVSEYIAVGILSIMVIMLFSGIGDELIVHLFAFVYPFIQTIKVIEAGNKRESTDWLIYWVIYGFLGVLDTFSDYFLYWIPFFAPAKLAFLVWCWAPSYKGSNTIYYSLVQPLFKQHESTIDSALKNVLDPKVITKTITAITLPTLDIPDPQHLEC